MRALLGFLVVLLTAVPPVGSPAGAQNRDELLPIEQVLLDHTDIIQKSSRTTVGPAIVAVRDSGAEGAQSVLEKWRDKELWARETDGRFFLVGERDGDTYPLLNIVTGEPAGTADKDDLKQIKPNSGIRALLSAALVQFQLLDPSIEKRRDAVTAIERDPDADHLAPLRASIAEEPDPTLKARKARLERLLTASFDDNPAIRINAINSFADDLGVDVRATLNPLLTTRIMRRDAAPEAANIAGPVTPGSADLSYDDALNMLIADGVLAAAPTQDERKAALVANSADGSVAGFARWDLDTQEKRDAAYDALAQTGAVPPRVDEAARRADVEQHPFVAVFNEPNSQVTDAAQAALAGISTRVGAYQALDLGLDAISLASIYFLAAIGLAITFGVMGVINMTHGEFIMMGAYTGYVVQQVIADHTLSIVVALPLAFAITFAAGVALERLVIRWLYHRPLETLLATFGISIALQQIAKNIFGTQARPLTAPGWLDGAWVINDVAAISYIRIAIFVLAVIFFLALLLVLNRTRLGLEVRAVTQNPRMAASMGINPDRINMLTFGLGSGIAGVAGVAIGLFAKVTSELGASYIVQSFMTVVIGGVGNIWGTLAGASLIGVVQKGIEWFNPSNTLAAQTYMIIFVIIFIQFRPKGIIALKGRAADG